ncbi:MAG: HisA/HisF-related TIM barrel protein [Actinomycetota bacterium]
MAFEVIPAIDVSNGRLARLHAGGPVPVEAFGGDPMAAGETFVAAGAGWLHVVDLDLAFTGRAANLGLLGRLASLGVRVQASGGIVRRADAEAALAAGADRVVLGSGALGAEWLPAALSGSLAEMLVMGLEVEGAVVRPRGAAGGEWPLDEILGRLAEGPARRTLVTAVARVGGLGGPDVAVVRAVADALGGPLLAAGGVATPAHVRAIAAIGPFVEGTIVGRALYEGAPLNDFLEATPRRGP